MHNDFYKAFKKAQRINIANKANKVHMVATVGTSFNQHTVSRESIDVVIVRSTLESIQSFTKGFDSRKKHSIGK